MIGPSDTRTCNYVMIRDMYFVPKDVRTTGLQDNDPRLYSVFSRLQGDAFQQHSIEDAQHQFIE